LGVYFNVLWNVGKGVCHAIVNKPVKHIPQKNRGFLMAFLHFCRMFKKLRERWKVNSLDLFLVLLTFALGGSLCGYLGRKLMLLTGIEKGVFWMVLYVLMVTLIWPFCVLVISIPFGQFPFFRKYIGKLIRRFTGKKSAKPTARLAVFASGNGSNALNIITYFENHPGISVNLLVCNKPEAAVIAKARSRNVEVLLIQKRDLEDSNSCLAALQKRGITHIILAGFLLKVPPVLIRAFPGRILNIHPALLPKFGGKGMFGQHVHEAVIAQKEKESGITIHVVDEQYDHGPTVFQARCEVKPGDTPESLAASIHALEQQYYPAVIESYIQKQNRR
jgi:formyltetrahydrofolate-dependent phosphoribosylglycinamide formyltransferase